MSEKALQHFTSAWDSIKNGNFFDEKTNSTFEYMLKNLWNSPYKNKIKSDILTHLSSLYEKTAGLENPPPFLYILLSLKDDHINRKLQELAVVDFVKSNAAEEDTYQLINLLETMSEHGVGISGIVNAVINNINPNMNKDMVEAISYMICVKHPEYLRRFLEKYVSMSDRALLKNFVNMMGRRAVLELMNMMTPGQVQKILQ